MAGRSRKCKDCGGKYIGVSSRCHFCASDVIARDDRRRASEAPKVTLSEPQARMLERAARPGGTWLRGSAAHQLADRLYNMGLVQYASNLAYSKRIVTTDAGDEAHRSLGASVGEILSGRTAQ